MRCRGVRNANAYILVYDICCVESFEYVKMIRQQIVEHRCVQLSWRPLVTWHRQMFACVCGIAGKFSSGMLTA